jgi:hypothetical protein
MRPLTIYTIVNVFLAQIGDPATLMADATWASWLKWVEKYGLALVRVPKRTSTAYTDGKLGED